ncbi:MAG: YdcF family protein [Clostridia bacterium]|nr:YdcF family protein [Clostridia bacterium]
MTKKAAAKQKKTSLKKVLLILFLLSAFAAAAVFVPNAIVKASQEKRIISLEEAAEFEKADCILALGCRVYSNGSMSPMLQDRVQLALDVYNAGVSDKLLMSGDHGQADYNEVQAMKDYLIENGVSSSDVFMDHAGFSTYDSLYRAKAVFNANRIIIVTHRFHLYRALYIAEKLGIEAYGVAVEDLYGGSTRREIREILARDKDIVKCIFKPKPTYLGDVIDVRGDGDRTND